MIITDRFVFVHLPKTGGTFVEMVLEKIHRARGEQLADAYWSPKSAWGLKNPIARFLSPRRPCAFTQLFHKRNGAFSLHGVTTQIPWEHRKKPILTVLRNPYDLYVSHYEYKWWLKQPPRKKRRDRIREAYPSFPDLTFEEFVHMSNDFYRLVSTGLIKKGQIGAHSMKFAEYFFRDPNRMKFIDDAYIEKQLFWKDIQPQLRPIFQENLNRQLHDFLLEMEYKPEEVAFILEHKPIRPPGSVRSDVQKWETYYSPALKAEVRQREKMLFAMYPQWDV